MVGKHSGSNKHIVWITPGFASSEKDDSCIPTLLDFLQYIQQNETLTISIVTLQYPFSAENYQVFGSFIYPMNGRNLWYKKVAVWKKTMRTLANLHTQYPIDLIHSFWLGDAALIGQAFSSDKKFKHICTLMGQDVLKNNRHLNNKRLKDLTTIALTPFQAEHFYKNTGRRVDTIIPWGLPNIFADIPIKKYDIIGVGSLIPVKNYEMWIEIIGLVKEKMPAIKAILVGDGEERSELQRLIEKKYLSSSMELVGQKSRKDVLGLIGESKLLLHTSKFEGQGYVFFEAMAQKLSILSTPVGYAVENEKIWKGTSAEAFADEIVHLLQNRDLKVNYQFPMVEETFKKYWEYYKK